jgi:hypothetical protein
MTENKACLGPKDLGVRRAHHTAAHGARGGPARSQD